MKRLYKTVQIVATPQGSTVALDGKPVNTPGRRPLLLPTNSLAEAIAAEWREQGASIRPDTMPLTQLAATVVDHIETNRPDVEFATLRFAKTDLVCYRAEEPPELVRRQHAAWDPLLEWLAQRSGIGLAVTAGVLPVEQGPEATAGLSRLLRAMNNWQMGAFQAAAAASGSFVIALALVEGRIDADEAFAAAELDESYGIERWGEDEEAAHRRAGILSDLAASRRFRDLLAGGL